MNWKLILISSVIISGYLFLNFLVIFPLLESLGVNLGGGGGFGLGFFLTDIGNIVFLSPLVILLLVGVSVYRKAETKKFLHILAVLLTSIVFILAIMPWITYLTR